MAGIKTGWFCWPWPALVMINPPWGYPAARPWGVAGVWGRGGVGAIPGRCGLGRGVNSIALGLRVNSFALGFRVESFLPLSLLLGDGAVWVVVGGGAPICGGVPGFGDGLGDGFWEFPGDALGGRSAGRGLGCLGGGLAVGLMETVGVVLGGTPLSDEDRENLSLKSFSSVATSFLDFSGFLPDLPELSL